MEDIINPENEYTVEAVKAASDILEFGRITYREAVEKQGGESAFQL